VGAAEARPPYESTSAKRARLRPKIPDDELDEVQAIEFARREQQRLPADLINVAA
jgi:hypothetical protein